MDELDPTTPKTCPKCEAVKTRADFSKHGRRADGLQYACKLCMKAANYDLLQRGGSTRKATIAAWQKANPEKMRAIKLRHRAKAEAKLVAVEYSRAWRAANPEKHAQGFRNWRLKNLDKCVEKVAARRATKKRAMPVWADRKAMRAIYAESTARRKAGEDVHVDHVVPLHSDLVCGLHVPANLAIMPARANIVKGNRFWPDMPTSHFPQERR